MTQEQLSIAIVQVDLVWEDPNANRVKLEKMIRSISENCDLIILPEMFSSGFTMQPAKVAETMEGKTVRWMQQLATEMEVAIMGSLVIKEAETYRNRLLFVHPTATVEFYDKRHSFTLAGEHKVYTAGNRQLFVNYKGWKLCPLICYDLRFPVWARNTEAYDLLLYVANWPAPRIVAWDALLKARAIENMSYCVGVNRVGEDQSGHQYPGHSAVYDVLGNTIADLAENKEGVRLEILQKEHIAKYRKKLQFLNDRDLFTLEG